MVLQNVTPNTPVETFGVPMKRARVSADADDCAQPTIDVNSRVNKCAEDMEQNVAVLKSECRRLVQHQHLCVCADDATENTYSSQPIATVSSSCGRRRHQLHRRNRPFARVMPATVTALS